MVLLNHAAVDVDDLAVDPASWAGEKRDSLRDVHRCAEAFQGSACNQCLLLREAGEGGHPAGSLGGARILRGRIDFLRPG